MAKRKYKRLHYEDRQTIEALGYLEGYQEHKEESGAGE